MMKRTLTTFFCLLCMVIAGTAADGNRAKRQLTRLFNEAEHCYLIDDYQQLETCLRQYDDTFRVYRYMIDSIDIYKGYYYKMRGAYYYGLSENTTYARYSERYYRRSLDVFNSLVRTRNIKGMHANAVTLHQELAQLYYKIGNYSMAKEQLDTVFTYFDGKLAEGVDAYRPSYYNTLSQLAMCNGRLGNYDKALSQIEEAIGDYFKKHKKEGYFEALRKKGKILMLQADSLGNTHYKKAVDCYRQYVNERITAIESEMDGMNESQRGQHWLATHQFLYDCFRLGNRAPEMLYDITLYSKGYLLAREHHLKTGQTDWKQVRKKLGKKDCAIEFVQYFGRGDKKRLGCLVLRHNSRKPLFIDLFATDSLLSLPLGDLNTVGNAITATKGTVKNTLYQDTCLARLIWSNRLMTAIGDADRVFFAPDGLLHQWAIEYIIPDSTKVGCRLSSTRNLVRKPKAPKLESALLCGGIEYNTDIKPVTRDNDVAAYRYLSPKIDNIKNLPWTLREVDSIFVCRHNPKDTLLVGKVATDEAFLQLLKHNYSVVHLATHGYFRGQIGIFSDVKPLLGDESMSRSGLFFAGSSKTLKNSNFDVTLFDGILSAAELSRLDFSNTDLVVLSACETAMGRLTDDGIYGIQRGLKLGGANAMILSLWDVNDYSANMLMRFFYQELEQQKVKDINTAFLKARQRMKTEKYQIREFDSTELIEKLKTYTFDTPQHMNPFILIDAY